MLAIVGGKGGCGKTTTAVGLGRAFVARGERVLLVDADCDTPNLHTVTDTRYSPGLGAVCDGVSLAGAVHESPAYPGVEVLPSGSRTGAVPPAVLDRVRHRAGRTLLDCPAGATSAVTTPLQAADAALVVSTHETESQHDAVKTARMARSLDTPVLGAVVTRVPARANPETGALADECRILETIPAVDSGVLADPVGRSTYRGLADSLASRNP